MAPRAACHGGEACVGERGIATPFQLSGAVMASHSTDYGDVDLLSFLLPNTKIK